jgi:transposase
VRPGVAPAPVIRFETPAGRQAQVDFAHFRFPWGVRYALLVVLGYSRLLWCRFSPRQDMATLMDGLEDAVRYFGGVPHELLFDQMKTVITRDLRLEGGALVRNLEFLRFAGHWGFTPRACRPYRAQTKGKVERPVRYLRSNFVYGRTFIHDADLDQQRLSWLDRVANVRIHATTQERPRDRFDRDERFLLQPLAARPYTSLILQRSASPAARRSPRPVVTVEKRSLAAYAQLTGGVS